MHKVVRPGDETIQTLAGLVERVRKDFEAKGESLIHENVLKAAGVSLAALVEAVEGEGREFPVGFCPGFDKRGMVRLTLAGRAPGARAVGRAVSG